MSRRKGTLEKAGRPEHPGRAAIAYAFGRHSTQHSLLAGTARVLRTMALAGSGLNERNPEHVARVRVEFTSTDPVQRLRDFYVAELANGLIRIALDAIRTGDAGEFRKLADAFEHIYSRRPADPLRAQLNALTSPGLPPADAKTLARMCRVTPRTVQRVAREMRVTLAGKPGRPAKAKA